MIEDEETWFDSDDAINPEAIKTGSVDSEPTETVFDTLPEPKYSLGLSDSGKEPETVKPKYSQKKYTQRKNKPVRDFEENPATEDELKNFFKQAENFIVWHLAQRDLTVHQARQKMVKKQKWPKSTIEQVIDKCLTNRWLDDEQYVENFIHSEQKWNKTGKYAIKMKLIKKGVSVDVIETALAEVETEDETAAAKELLIKQSQKINHLPDEKKTQRLLGMLSRKGYPASIAYPLVREIVKNPDIILDEWE